MLLPGEPLADRLSTVQPKAQLKTGNSKRRVVSTLSEAPQNSSDSFLYIECDFDGAFFECNFGKCSVQFF